VCCSVLQCVAVCCRALQCVTVFCMKKPCVTTKEPLASANERSISAEYNEALRVCTIHRISAEEPYETTEEPCESAKEPYVTTKKSLESAKEPSISSKYIVCLASWHCVRVTELSLCVMLAKYPLLLLHHHSLSLSLSHTHAHTHARTHIITHIEHT